MNRSVVNINPQNYNKYSYVLNNPLKFTDPSGYRGQRVYKLRPPDFDGANHRLQMDREQDWAIAHNRAEGDGLFAFMAVMYGGGGGGGGWGGAPDGGSAAGDVTIVGGENPTVTNNSSQPIMVRFENGDLIILQPTQSCDQPIDGFTIPFAEGLVVYKVADPFNFYPYEVYDSDIDISSDIDPIGLLKEFNDIVAGEVSISWIINDLQKRGWSPEPTLSGWRPLFEFVYYNY